jgi:hypothetical protein
MAVPALQTIPGIGRTPPSSMQQLDLLWTDADDTRAGLEVVEEGANTDTADSLKTSARV